MAVAVFQGDPDVLDRMDRLKLPQDLYDKARQWYEKVCTQSYLVRSFKIPGSHRPNPTDDPKQGMFLAMSTAQSCRVDNDNRIALKAGLPGAQAGWVYMDVYFFEEMAFGNWGGIMHARHQGQCIGALGALLRAMCIQKDITNFDEYTMMRTDEYALRGFRILLSRLKIPYWLELTGGLSIHALGAIDVYTRIQVGSMPPPPEEAWYLLNYEDPYRVTFPDQEWS